MEIILLLIVLGALVAGAFLIAFFWALGDGQFDDTVTPGFRVLDDSSSTDAKSEAP